MLADLYSKELQNAMEDVRTQVLYVDGGRSDSYTEDGTDTRPFKTISGAIASITDASAVKKYTVRIASGSYEENVVLKRHVIMAGLGGFGLGHAVKIWSATGVTLTMPSYDSCFYDLFIETQGAMAAEAAVRVIDDGGPVGEQSFMVNSEAASTTIARALWFDNTGATIVGIYFGVTGSPGGDTIYSDNTAFIWLLGGGGDAAECGIRLVNGAMMLAGGSVGISASEVSGTAWAIEADASFVVFQEGRIAASNGIRLRNGSTAFLGDASSIGGFGGGNVVDCDITSAIVVGDVRFDNPGMAPLLGWTMLGTTVLQGNGREGIGITAGPDQRPVGAPVGFRFFATNLGVAAGGMWLTWNGAAWVDPTGAVVP